MKAEILSMLREAAPEYVSGEALSRELGVSRTAVWKYVKELKQEDYVIEASSRKGYRLVSLPDRPNSLDIGYRLGTAVIGSEIFYFDSIDSTSKYARKLASEGCRDGTVVAAGMQTDGRGRLGRKWESPEGKGIYVSIVLRPSIPPEEIHIITIAAAAAAASAIEKSTGLTAGIKWPNDIIIEGRKVCGILTEMSSEIDRVDFAVCGIGINFSQETGDFPEELRDKAISIMTAVGSIREKSAALQSASASEAVLSNNGDQGYGLSRLDIIRSLLRELDSFYALAEAGRGREITDAWKSRSVTLGRDVCILYRDGEMKGRAVDITEDGRLAVQLEDGTIKNIMSGEVSVRGLLGYV